MAKRPGHRTYPIPAHRGERSEIGDQYISGFCRNFGIDPAAFRARLQGLEKQIEQGREIEPISRLCWHLA
jgi:hypothetical protein